MIGEEATPARADWNHLVSGSLLCSSDKFLRSKRERYLRARCCIKFENVVTKLIIALMLLTLFLTATLHAMPMGASRVNVIELRPYAGSPVAYLRVSSAELCGTDAFTIPLTDVGGKEMYAAALAALMSGKQIGLEVSNATGCTGWGTRLQSIFIYP